MLNLPPDHPLAGMVRRFRRADAELHTLDGLVAEFERTKSGRFALDDHPSGHSRILAFPEQPDPDWGIDAGDILSHLRACLDYLVYQIAVEHHRKEPPPGEDRIQFPIYSPGKPFPDSTVTGWVGSDACDWLKSVQPQPGTQYLELGRIARLTNRYKHRRLAVVAMGIIQSSIQVVALRDCIALEQPTPFNGVVEYGQEIGRMRFRHTGPHPQYRVEGHMTEGVVFGEGGPFAGEPVGGVLHAIRDVVEGVIRDGWLKFFRVYRKRLAFAVPMAVTPTITTSGGCGHWRPENISRDGFDLVHNGYADHAGCQEPSVVAEANP